MSNIFKNVITFVVSFLLCIIAAEFVLRFFEVKDFALLTKLTDDGFYVVHKSNIDRDRYESESNKKVHIKTNDQGFVGNNFNAEKASGTLRVAVLGDSFTEAFQVDYEKTFAYLMKENFNAALTTTKTPFNDIDVYNFGLGGIGTADEMKYYVRFVKKYKPDVVVLAFYLGNDISDNGYYYEKKDVMLSSEESLWESIPQYGAPKQKDMIALKDRIFRGSAIIRLVDRAVRGNPVLNSVAVKFGLYRQPVSKNEFGIGIPFWHYYYIDPLDEERSNHLKFSADLINNFHNVLEEDNVKFVLMLIPEGMTVDKKLFGDFKLKYPNLSKYNFNPVAMEDKLIGLINPSVNILNLRPIMEEKILENKLMYLQGVYHFSEGGHEVVAQKLINSILSFFNGAKSLP